MSSFILFGLLAAAPALANPTCPVLDSLVESGVFSVDTSTQTDDFSPSCVGDRGVPDAPIAFEAVTGGAYRFETTGGITDTVITAFDNDCTTAIACDDDGGIGRRSRLYIDLLPGQTVLLVIDGFDGNDVGDVTLEANLAVCGDAVTDPGETCDDGNDISGDGCEIDCTGSLFTCAVDGQLIEGLPFIGDTSLDTDDFNPTCTRGGNGIPDIELSFVATTTGTYRFSTRGAGGVNDTVLAVFAEDCATEIACDDDGGRGLFSTAYVDLIADDVVQVVVDGFDGNDVGLTSVVGELAVCGDDVVDPGEVCDDGNGVDGDGCDSDCTESCTDLDADGVCDLDLQVTTLVPGGTVTFTAEHALPGVRVFFLVSGRFDPARATCRNGVCVDLLNPAAVGSAVADAQGVASLTVQAPGVVPPVVLAQAVWAIAGGSDVSNVVNLTSSP